MTDGASRAAPRPSAAGQRGSACRGIGCQAAASRLFQCEFRVYPKLLLQMAVASEPPHRSVEPLNPFAKNRMRSFGIIQLSAGLY
jgi:hypothetical protein